MDDGDTIPAGGRRPTNTRARFFMEFRFAFLANGAEVGPDGRFFVLGGGIDGISVPSVPIRFPALAALARFHFPQEECQGQHQVELTLTLPDGGDSGIRISATVTPEPNKHFGHPGANVDVAFSLYNLLLTQAGVYRLNFAVDGRRLGHHDVGVEVSGDPV
jgi:hypothetical protein